MPPTWGLCVILFSVSTISAYLVIQEPSDDDCQRTGPKCSADCKDIIFCAVKGGASLHVGSCDDFCQIPEADAGGVAYPACGGTSCKSDGFQCLAPGGLPDPTNTTTYYLCPAVFMPGIQVSCPAGQSFDVTKRTCGPSDGAITIEVKECPVGQIEFGPLDTAKVFCYLCNDQGNLLVYPCSLETVTKMFESIGYQLPAY